MHTVWKEFKKEVIWSKERKKKHKGRADPEVISTSLKKLI